jgi:hypothetical protein
MNNMGSPTYLTTLVKEKFDVRRHEGFNEVGRNGGVR